MKTLCKKKQIGGGNMAFNKLNKIILAVVIVTFLSIVALCLGVMRIDDVFAYGEENGIQAELNIGEELTEESNEVQSTSAVVELKNCCILDKNG